MRDWTAYVRRQLELRELREDRADRIVQELAEHLEDSYREARRGGASEAEAEAIAREQVPRWETFAADLRRVERPNTVPGTERWLHRLEDLARRWGGVSADLPRDLRQGLRFLRREPGFTAVAAVTLALGIAANAAVFSVVQGVLLRPLPYVDPDRLVMLRLDGEGLENYPGLSWAEVRSLQEGTRLFAGFGSVVGFSASLTAEGNMEQVPAATITPEVLPLLGSRPILGRNFDEQDAYAELGRYPSVILSYDLWRRRYGSDPGIVGRDIEVDNRSRTVVGVMPEGFRLLLGPGTHVDPAADLWIPPSSDLRFLHIHAWRTLGRLQPGVTPLQGQEEVQAIGARVIRRYPDAYGEGDLAFRVTPLHHDLTSGVRRAVLILFGAAAFVLLIGCANIANLQLARGAQRTAELAVRVSLGASRARLLRQIVTENVLLGLLGGGAGLGLAWLGLRALLLLPTELPRAAEVALDGTVVAFILVVSVASGILFGLIPAWRGARSDPGEALRAAGRRVVRSGLDGGLLVSEVAVSLVLLVGAGLMVRSLVNLRQEELGFEPRDVLTLDVSVDIEKLSTVPERWRFYRRVLEEVTSLPGVRSAGGIRRLPLHHDQFDSGYALDGETERQFLTRSASYDWVLPGYFATMGIDVLHGRVFTARDNERDQLVVVVDESLARGAWPGQDPIGRQLLVDAGFPRFDLRRAEVIGVVEHVRSGSLRETGSPQIYLPYANVSATASTNKLVVATYGQPAGLAATLRDRVQALGGGRPVHSIRPLDSYVADATAETRFALVLLGILAVTAVVLSTVGAFGVISHGVSRRTREIGIRKALGARSGQILISVVGRGARLAGAGVLLGLAAAAGLAQLLETMLYEIAPTDPPTLAATAVFLVVVTVLACFLPARRATRVDPTVALRQE